MENKKNENNNLSDRELDLYKMQYNAHLTRFMNAGSSFEQAILTLSVASLGFIFAFIKVHPDSSHFCLLYFTWFFLILSISLLLFTLLVDLKDTENQLNIQSKAIKEQHFIENNDSQTAFLLIFLPRIACVSYFLALLTFSAFVHLTL